MSMWNHLTPDQLCGHGGYCRRIPGHQGCHTAYPAPTTHKWDRRIHDAVTLLMLDWPAPPWADILDNP